MITNKTPTETGNYHFKAEGSDEWSLVEVFYWNSNGQYLHVCRHYDADLIYSINDFPNSQWQRLYNPDEVQQAWAVYLGDEIIKTGKTQQDAINKFALFMGLYQGADLDQIQDVWDYAEEKEGYTCKPVAIVPRDSEVEG